MVPILFLVVYGIVAVASGIKNDMEDHKYFLYTKSNMDKPYELKNGDNENFKKSKFNPEDPTKILIHGWLNNYLSPSVQIIKNAYLSTGNFNVIICKYTNEEEDKINHPKASNSKVWDKTWHGLFKIPENLKSKGELGLNYVTSALRAESAAKNINEMISFLIKNGLNLKKLHIVGHSLGAQIAATIGNARNGGIARITGLDPPTKVVHNLSARSADYVDCIHSSWLGSWAPCGSVDFYMNKGINQPTCPDNGVMPQCDHEMSYRYWANSIKNKDAYPAKKCSIESKMLAGMKSLKILKMLFNHCSDEGGIMGDAAINRTQPGLYFVSVDDEVKVL